ncbi:calcium:proton antiporter [Variovorax sp. KK3]|uniref:calcium:proton antiporter n=1 Tax=Variovorax sp. KK3 TaxID=1855728 RepID=UPI00097C27D0|nr:calcium:proton antiporter [Variovorax sp. KK3]
MSVPRPRNRPLAREWPLAVSIAAAAFFLLFGDAIWPRMVHWPVLVLAFGTLFAAVVNASLAVIRHAERLAEMLGDPYGTLILTLSVTLIEITSISSVMLHGDSNPTLTRDTLFAVVMIIMNGMVGLALLAGGWRHGEQMHNLQGANVYLSAAIPMLVFGLVLPGFTRPSAGPALSIAMQAFIVIVSVGLYLVFLRVQMGRHRHYFSAEETGAGRHGHAKPEIVLCALKLAANLVPALLLAHEMSHPIDHLIETLNAPAAVGGVLIAILVALPEGMGAVRAALGNQLQRSVNISLGSMLSTVGLTIPAMVVIGALIGQPPVLGVQGADLVLLALTLAVSIVTFSSGRTNVIQGAVHLTVFFAYLVLIFQG